VQFCTLYAQQDAATQNKDAIQLAAPVPEIMDIPSYVHVVSTQKIVLFITTVVVTADVTDSSGERSVEDSRRLV
jgi:hypothetical protein